MEYYSHNNRPGRKREKFDNKYQVEYKKEINKQTGKVKLVEKNKVNVYDKIQEYAEETKLSNILKRYNVSMLSQLKDSETELIDLTNLPENLLETMTAIKNAEYLWERQSTKTKAEFNNDFRQFIASFENGKMAQMLQKEAGTKTEQFTKEVQQTAGLKPTQTTTTTTPTQTTNTEGGITTNV